MSMPLDKKSLKLVAHILITDLRNNPGISHAHISKRLCIEPSETYGWSVVLGRLDHGSTRLELWLDRYTRARERHFWFGFYSTNLKNIQRIIRHSPNHLRPGLTLKEGDVEKSRDHHWRLKTMLRQKGFNHSIRELYSRSRYYYYGQFDPCINFNSRNLRRIARRAMAFFDEVLGGQPTSKKLEQNWDIYPKTENRKVVRQHISRERSRTLAEYCKERDKYRCRVCNTHFEEVYGELGSAFAEAHHLIPLKQLRRITSSSPDDLITVCSNCHRMLHKLDGNREDFKKLKRLVRSRSK
jgi:5-methylcytosine-specific restriction endonuclease McrA